MNWETYQNAYINAAPQLQELLNSGSVPDCVKASLARREASSLRKATIVEISAYVIGIQTIDETVEKMTKLGIPDALQFLAEVQTCINGHDTKIQQTPVVPSPSEILQSEIKAAEHDLESIKGLRTMAHDMKEAKVHPITPHTTNETTHHSSQDDLLQKPPTVPASEPTTTWGSDR